MASELGIINRAFIELGEGLGTNLDDTTEEMDKAKSILPNIMEEVLSAHQFDFAKKRKVLTRLTEDPAYGDYWVYNLPPDHIHLMKEDPSLATEVPYIIEGEKILVDKLDLSSTEAFNFRYTSKDILYGRMNAVIAKAISLGIASAMAYDFTGSASAAEQMERKFQKAKREAKSHQQMSGSSDTVLGDNSFITSREI